jgi:hypothetical protein
MTTSKPFNTILITVPIAVSAVHSSQNSNIPQLPIPPYTPSLVYAALHEDGLEGHPKGVCLNGRSKEMSGLESGDERKPTEFGRGFEVGGFEKWGDYACELTLISELY